MNQFYTHSISINATKEKVWNALTNPEITKQYLYGCEVQSNWIEGNDVIWKGAADGMVYVTGKVVTYKPYNTLALTTFNPHGSDEDIPENHLLGTHTLEEENGVTTLSIKQGDFTTVANGAQRYEEAKGAWEMTFQALKTLLEQ